MYFSVVYCIIILIILIILTWNFIIITTMFNTHTWSRKSGSFRRRSSDSMLGRTAASCICS
jgi:hypothetical protein